MFAQYLILLKSNRVIKIKSKKTIYFPARRNLSIFGLNLILPILLNDGDSDTNEDDIQRFRFLKSVGKTNRHKIGFCIIKSLDTKSENTTSLAIQNSGSAHFKMVVFLLIQNELEDYINVYELPLTFLFICSSVTTSYHAFSKFCNVKTHPLKYTSVSLYEIRKKKLKCNGKGFTAIWYPFCIWLMDLA